MQKKFFVPIIVIGIFIGAVALAYGASALWNKPLGPNLGISTSVPESTGVSAEVSITDGNAQADIAEVTATPESLLSKLLKVFRHPQNTDEPLCGGPSTMTILLIGSDERSNDYLYGLADSIRIVRVDFIKPQVMMVDVPRDLWVEIPGISDHYDITHGKINQAYFFGNPGMGYYDGPGEGPGLLARTLEVNFGLKVDRYLASDRSTFVSMIDTIGGIDVHLDSTANLNAADSPIDPRLVLPPGNYHLDGNRALLLASSRNPTIFQRARYQNLVLSAIQDKLLSPAMLPELPGLIAQFTKAVQTDFSPSEISSLICLAKSIDKDNTVTVEFPESLFTSSNTYDQYRRVNTFILEADFNQLRAYFADFMNGSWPSGQ